MAGSPSRGGYCNGRNQPLSGSGSITHDFNANQNSNQPLKVYLVIPGEPDLTQALSSFISSLELFCCQLSDQEYSQHNQTDNVQHSCQLSLFGLYSQERGKANPLQNVVEAHYNGCLTAGV